jgi:hypothetical protein
LKLNMKLTKLMFSMITSILTGTSRIAKAFYITIFGFIPLIAIITFYFYYANDYLKKLCLEISRGGLRAQLAAAAAQQ